LFAKLFALRLGGEGLLRMSIRYKLPAAGKLPPEHPGNRDKEPYGWRRCRGIIPGNPYHRGDTVTPILLARFTINPVPVALALLLDAGDTERDPCHIDVGDHQEICAHIRLLMAFGHLSKVCRQVS
jgi:hypothetical protein